MSTKLNILLGDDEILVVKETEKLEVKKICEEKFKIAITYKNGKTYRYDKENVSIKKAKTTIECNDGNKQIIINEIIQTDIKKIFEFDNYYKVIFNDKPYYYKKENTKIVINNLNLKEKQVLEYFGKIVTYKDNSGRKDNQEIDSDKRGSFYQNQMNNLQIRNNFLEYYLNPKSLKNIASTSEDLLTIFPYGLNESQFKAVNMGISQNLTIIQGPPGTGKTQTILNIIANLVIRDKTIAITSGNNPAVQNIVDKLAKEDLSFIIATLGKRDNQKAFFDNQVVIPTIENWLLSSEQQKNLEFEIQKSNQKLNSLLKLNNEKTILENELKLFEREHSLFQRYNPKIELPKYKKLFNRKMNSEDGIKLLIDIQQQQLQKSGIKAKFTLFWKYKLFDTSNLFSEPDYVEKFQKHFYVQKIKELKEKISRIQHTLTNYQFEIIMDKLKVDSMSYFKNSIARKFSKIEEQPFTLENYKKHFDEFQKRYPIICSTVHALGQSKAENVKFDYEIIDEASQVECVPGVFALSHTKNLIIVGDTAQLPHIPEQTLIKGNIHQQLLKEYSIKEAYNYVTNSLLASITKLFPEEKYNILLREHYRCHPDIIGFCNQKFYNNELIVYTKSENTTPLEHIVTVEGNHNRDGRINLREISEIAEYLKKEESGETGVISPYRKQVNLATETLSDLELAIDTVHKFQGRECETMIMSTVLDNTFISKNGFRFIDMAPLVNVAISRAKDKFILVTDKTAIEKNTNNLRDFIKYMNYSRPDFQIIQGEVRSIFDLLYKTYSEEAHKYLTNAKKSSRYKSENLMEELLTRILATPDKGEDYEQYEIAFQVYLKNIFDFDDEVFDEEEKTYIKNNASIDFIIYNKYDKKPNIFIEVDGYNYHKEGTKQFERDKIKNRIFSKKGLILNRFSTISDYEEPKLRNLLNQCNQRMFN